MAREEESHFEGDARFYTSKVEDQSSTSLTLRPDVSHLFDKFLSQ